MSTSLKFENTDTILSEARIFPPLENARENANITTYMQAKGFNDYETFYRWSLEHRMEYWEDLAKELHWFEPWHTTFTWTEQPFFQWFVGGKFNVVHNCLDRHMHTPTRHKVAFYWEGDDGTSRTVTYEELYKLTNRFARGLQKLRSEEH